MTQERRKLPRPDRNNEYFNKEVLGKAPKKSAQEAIKILEQAATSGVFTIEQEESQYGEGSKSKS